MSVHQKKNGTWFVHYRVSGEKNPRQEYFGVGDEAKKKAQIRDAEIKLQKASGQRPVPSDGEYLDTVAQAYVTDRKLAGASAKWLAEISWLLNKFVLPELTKAPIDGIRYPDVIAFVNRQWGDRALATRQRYLGYLKAIFRFAVEHGYAKNNPLVKWKKVREPKRDMRLTVEDLGKIMRHAAPHLRWAIEVEWELGTRPGPSELFRIRWDDVDFAQCIVHVRGTKTHEANRVIPILPEFRDRLAATKAAMGGEYVVSYKGEPVKRLNKALQRAAERAGIGYPVRMYDIRHLYASVMLANGSDLAAVSKILGHSTIATTQEHYYHVLKGEMGRAIASRPKLDFD